MCVVSLDLVFLCAIHRVHGGHRMASLILTLENEKRSVKVIGDLLAGWQSSPSGYGFRGRSSMDYVGDTRLVVNLDVKPPNRMSHAVIKLPPCNTTPRSGESSRYYELKGTKLEVTVDIEKHREILYTSQKPGVHWQSGPIKCGLIDLWLNLLIYVQPRHAKAKIIWEHDVLPFLPGGRPESNRARF